MGLYPIFFFILILFFSSIQKTLPVIPVCSVQNKERRHTALEQPAAVIPITFQRNLKLPTTFKLSELIYNMVTPKICRRDLFTLFLVGLLLALGFSLVLYELDNGTIAFASERDGNEEIYVMDSDGGNQRNVTCNPASDFSPAWSLDGKKIAFSSSRDGNEEIYVMDSDGYNVERLTYNLDWDMNPAWSPDGKKIAFSSIRDNEWDIYVMNIEEGTTKNLTKASESNLQPHPSYLRPTWSPDGKKIAFEVFKIYPDIYVMDSDGSNPRNVTDYPIWDSQPAWSPDGKKIAFVSLRDGNYEVYVIDVDGLGVKKLTDDPALDERPAWSPDGKKIAFVSTRDGNCDIYVMNYDGSEVKRLTTDPADDLAPAWGCHQFSETTLFVCLIISAIVIISCAIIFLQNPFSTED